MCFNIRFRKDPPLFRRRSSSLYSKFVLCIIVIKMIPVQTVVRVAPSVCRNFVQLRGVTRTTNVVSAPASVKITFAVCDIHIYFSYTFRRTMCQFFGKFSPECVLYFTKYSACRCVIDPDTI